MLQAGQIGKAQIELLGVVLLRVLQDFFRGLGCVAHHYIIQMNAERGE